MEFLAFGRGKADRIAAERLEIPVGDPVFRMRNRLRLGGTPIMVDDIVVPVARFPKLTEATFRNRPSTVYNLYQEAFGISVVRTSERLRATVADADTAGVLRGRGRRAAAADPAGGVHVQRPRGRVSRFTGEHRRA